MAETILLALLFAKIRRYEIKPLFKTWTFYPIIIFEIIFLFGQLSIFLGHYEFISFLKSLNTFYFCTYLLLVFKYRIYLQSIIGSIFMLIGGGLNDIVIKANDGFMPVFPTLSYLTGYAKTEAFVIVKDIHMLGNSQTKLKILTDFIDLGYSILSIGDVFIRAFVFIIIYNSIKKINNQRRK
ncbi:DUF5317 family protein [Clostridium saccharoperbutylacetonicum]|uniref:DUF5317 domain-containing protein n=1 Tax=Clostridium saccharoperbutylacetonicum N1-4(HMT) TaxID=931276 RepID=M1MMQ6_9CLOT|nr:DUF5317 family protein [Clostridium saccharoperbutylacetonicum]AGF56021.1 hypothetical protein Cspa_c22560 [Clostridium saccharoperbutylacetonicum N1-4(HMT)]AQR94756.1 hypothetical protein CLSAP_20700 [Clostridium saccharoperbutylacetonicum]NRT63240.1 hypothetical protein [Clostridium saccharoperbutylacetonicum]NSB26600.1 hypothetical protein [Clostridium saccharoperbutylacetonicum]NSB30597.1 hypothetical protein [Clostridium saccharoperbutylacetonicum]